jgi:hypothetical protein
MMISLCLQVCPLDLGPAFELVQLICDLEKHRREGTEFFLIYRKDVPLWVGKEFEKIARPKFERALALQARNYDIGWPGGSNMLAMSAMMEMALLFRQGACRSPAYLLFEPDCVPLAFDWMDQLSAEWEITKGEAKEAFGHWNMPGGILENLHMNGNAVFRSDFFDLHPQWTVGSANQGWDFFYRDKYISVSRDSYAIHQLYNIPSISQEDLEAQTKHGRRPALLHGIKDDSARRAVRMMLFRSASPSESVANAPISEIRNVAEASR